VNEVLLDSKSEGRPEGKRDRRSNKSDRPEEVTTRELSQFVVLATGKAMDEGHAIVKCERCGGPDVRSKMKPLSRCFRCGLKRRTGAVVRPRRCLQCRRLFSSAVSWQRCDGCRRVGKRAA
jgi:hypothetical protein